MKFIPKSYYHDKTILGLLAFNAALLIITLIFTLSGVDGENARSVVTYRASVSEAKVIGDTSYLYNFAIFALITTLASVVLSVRLFTHRHRLAMSVLGLNLVLLLMTIRIFEVLIGSR